MNQVLLGRNLIIVAAIFTPPVVFGLPIDPNVALAVVSIILGWVGFALIFKAEGNIGDAIKR